MMRPSALLRKPQFGLWALLVLAAALAVWQGVTMRREATLPERTNTARPVQVRADGFESSDACRACHPNQYTSWHASYHRTMTQVATPHTIAPSFDNVQVNDLPGEPMRLEVRGQELWADFGDPDGVRLGDRVGVRPLTQRIQRRVVMTTGSHHQQIFWYETGRSRMLGQLPAIWLIADRRWIPRRAAVMRPPGPSQSETGAWNAICVACHTTDGRPRLDAPFDPHSVTSQAADTSSAEFGIACEACHGPSAGHVRANALPQRRYELHLTGSPDPTIVVPDRLNPKRSSQVCGQCHSVWEFRDAAGERRANTQGLGYRPGDDLAATRFIVRPANSLEPETLNALLRDDPGFVRDTFWSDGMVRATGREYNGMIESPCYQHARNDGETLTCFSCHTMHKAADDRRALLEWADDQLSTAALGNGACLQCHARLVQPVVGADPRVRLGAVPSTLVLSLSKDELRAGTRVDPYSMSAESHTHHRADSSGSACYNCHMPYTTYGLLKTVRSHQISSPTAKETIETGRPNACNLCHLDKTLAWTADTLNKWYKTPLPAVSDDDRSVAASLVTLLKGDAGQRAIVAQSMGWSAAQQASGTAWIAPYLALLVDDPYDAVRYIAGRSMGTLPGYTTFRFDFVAPPQARAAARVRALEIWRDTRQTGRNVDPALLFNPDGTFNAPVIDRLRRERDNRRVVYRE